MSEANQATTHVGDNIPPWMRAVDADTLYNARSESSGEDSKPQRNAMRFVDRREEAREGGDRSGDAGRSSFGEKLTVMMGAPSELPRPHPKHQPKPIGPVNAQVERRLRTALAVLQSRYAEECAQSLVVEVALHAALKDLWEKGEDSGLVQRLDAVLRRG